MAGKCGRGRIRMCVWSRDLDEAGHRMPKKSSPPTGCVRVWGEQCGWSTLGEMPLRGASGQANRDAKEMGRTRELISGVKESIAGFAQG